jgi:hypothetical protein
VNKRREKIIGRKRNKKEGKELKKNKMKGGDEIRKNKKGHYTKMCLRSLWVSLDFERIWTFLP